MKIAFILFGCFLIAGSVVSQGNAFEILPTGKGLTQYRFNQTDLLYQQGNRHNIDITSVPANNVIHTLGTLEVAPENIFFKSMHVTVSRTNG